MSDDFQAVTYVKGDQVRVVGSRKELVQAEWEGFSLPGEADVTRQELQAQAKSLGIPANKSSDSLRDAIASFVPSDNYNGDTTPVGTENADPQTPVLDS